MDNIGRVITSHKRGALELEGSVVRVWTAMELAAKIVYLAYKMNIPALKSIFFWHEDHPVPIEMLREILQKLKDFKMSSNLELFCDYAIERNDFQSLRKTVGDFLKHKGSISALRQLSK